MKILWWETSWYGEQPADGGLVPSAGDPRPATLKLLISLPRRPVDNVHLTSSNVHVMVISTK
jgi:hypothetical protein